MQSDSNPLGANEDIEKMVVGKELSSSKYCTADSRKSVFEALHKASTPCEPYIKLSIVVRHFVRPHTIYSTWSIPRCFSTLTFFMFGGILT